MYKKTTTTVEEFFDAPSMAARPALPDPKLVKPIIRIDAPLMMSILEYAREKATTDEELHSMVERMMEMCEYGTVLEMEDYDEIVMMEETYTGKEVKTAAPPTK